MARRQRLDAELVRRALVTSRAHGARAIDEMRVLVNGAMADKPARLVHAGDAIELTGPPPRFVSRGGEKLDAALEHFGIEVSGLVALDAGASTGGFTDCLLQRGAARVVALDVGHGQLHPRIRSDNRVQVLERFHVRDVTPAAIGGDVDIVVADLSFISITRVLPALIGACRPAGMMVLLVKPQFEAGRAEVGRGHGVITDPLIHARVQAEVQDALTAAGCAVCGWMVSPLVGGHGNIEMLVSAHTPTARCQP